MPSINAGDGDRIRCIICGGLHSLEKGRHYVTRKIMDCTLVYRCGDKQFIGAVDGALVSQLAKNKGRRIWRTKAKGDSHGSARS